MSQDSHRYLNQFLEILAQGTYCFPHDHINPRVWSVGYEARGSILG